MYGRKGVKKTKKTLAIPFMHFSAEVEASAASLVSLERSLAASFVLLILFQGPPLINLPPFLTVKKVFFPGLSFFLFSLRWRKRKKDYLRICCCTEVMMNVEKLNDVNVLMKNEQL